LTPHINAVGTAVPSHDVHDVFIDWARGQVEPRALKLFDRMSSRSGIRHRWSVLPPTAFQVLSQERGFYHGTFPGTAARMEVYAETAPELALEAIADLGARADLRGVTHIVVASCTGFVAPGIDQIIARRLDLSPSVERLLVGFMGCYAAVAALRSARHIVRSDPKARVLVVTVELCTLHLQDTGEIEPLLAMLQFGDGAAAALVTAEPRGFAIDQPFATTLPESHDLIRWNITDQGFVMHLSGEVPSRIAQALSQRAVAEAATGGRAPAELDGWAVHAGGRSILDAVQNAFALPSDALDASRAILNDYGNMSSATLMFVLARLLSGPPIRQGLALAFGPGLAAEGFGFRSAVGGVTRDQAEKTELTLA
jgi:predicted naringenin-chalcone synthase